MAMLQYWRIVQRFGFVKNDELLVLVLPFSVLMIPGVKMMTSSAQLVVSIMVFRQLLIFSEYIHVYRFLVLLVVLHLFMN